MEGRLFCVVISSEPIVPGPVAAGVFWNEALEFFEVVWIDLFCFIVSVELVHEVIIEKMIEKALVIAQAFADILLQDVQVRVTGNWFVAPELFRCLQCSYQRPVHCW